MSLDEAFLFLEAQNKRREDDFKQTKMIVWSVFQSQSRKKISLRDMLGEGENNAAPRSGITKYEHLALVEKYKKLQKCHS